MKDALDRFEALAARARCEKAVSPGESVAPAVLRRVRQGAAATDRPLLWLAAGSLAVAMFSVAINYTAVFESSDLGHEFAVYAGWALL